MAKKRLVIRCDGTWNKPDQVRRGVLCPTNVVKIARATTPVAPDGTVQVVFYDQGVGTELGLDRLTGGAFGVGLSKNVEDAYRFVVDNYSPGDDLFLFGFSRGAYTARSVAGLIRKSGILKKVFAHEIPEAYMLYRRRDVHPDDEPAKRFRERFSFASRIKFIGVWDTVGALGIPVRGLRFLTRRRHEFHDVQLSRTVDNAFHALAIDERRKPFAPTLWETRSDTQRVEQVWFAGVHSNIGGGYPEAGLSDVTFEWMRQRAEECGLAISSHFAEAHIKPDHEGRLVNSKTGLYRLTRDHIRCIGDTCRRGGDPREAVHASAIERFNNPDLDYDPKNLRAHLATLAAG